MALPVLDMIDALLTRHLLLAVRIGAPAEHREESSSIVVDMLCNSAFCNRHNVEPGPAADLSQEQKLALHMIWMRRYAEQAPGVYALLDLCLDVANHASPTEAVVALQQGKVHPPLLLEANVTILHLLCQDITAIKPRT